MSQDTVLLSISTVEDYIRNLLLKQGYSESDADIVRDVLMYAELRENNQGIIKLIAGALKPNPSALDITTVFETPVSAKIDGGQKIGMCVLHKSVAMAIEKASISGIGIVGCSNYSSATGALGVWARQIARAGHIGIVMIQCAEMVAPYGKHKYSILT